MTPRCIFVTYWPLAPLKRGFYQTIKFSRSMSSYLHPLSLDSQPFCKTRKQQVRIWLIPLGIWDKISKLMPAMIFRNRMMIPTILVKSFYDIKFNPPKSNRPKKKSTKAYGSLLHDSRYFWREANRDWIQVSLLSKHLRKWNSVTLNFHSKTFSNKIISIANILVYPFCYEVCTMGNHNI